MSSEVEITETPNWLKELEAKRERRLKTKLGHELGAGAPCLTCDVKCPGLDLHFWRKICKNCKCSKENHEVQDDDIYGWAQDELLGTKVNRLKKKIVLPGRKDEVELEWTPAGQKETIDKYLEALPTELLPIKGSQAAQDRKQLLKKQIPIHDIDPTLCHDLTDEELKKMQEYVAHIKQSSVGVGRLIQVNFGKGTNHILDKSEAMFLINNVPKGIASSENVLLQGSNNTVPLKNLANRLNNLRLVNQREINSQFSSPAVSNVIDEQSPVHHGIRDVRYTASEILSTGNNNSFKSPLDVYNPQNSGTPNEEVRGPEATSLRTLNYPDNTFVPEQQFPVPFQNPYGASNVKNLVPSAFVPVKLNSDESYKNRENSPASLDKGTARELPYPSQFIDDSLAYGRKLPNYNSQTFNTLNPAYFEPIKDLNYSPSYNGDPQKQYWMNSLAEKERECLQSSKGPMESNLDEIGSGGGKTTDFNIGGRNFLQQTAALPQFASKNTEISEDQVEPIRMNSLRDLAHSTYDSPVDDDFHNLSVKDRLNSIKKRELSGFRPIPSNIAANDTSLGEEVVFGGDKSGKSNISEALSSGNLDPQGNNNSLQRRVLPINSMLPSYAPETRNIWEDTVQPSSIKIGGIRDIEYEDPVIRTALTQDNDLFQGAAPNKFIPNLNSEILPSCHYCKEMFKQDELAIAIPERSDAIFHTECFKCHGCNQILADMFYFYDKLSDDIYCGRDYAKIRGIPRCKACDELIFVKEYCLAENCTFHVKHFCCFECDKPLAGQNYVMENDQPVCVPCYELTKANKCYACKEVIHPDQQGLQLKDNVHFHATEDCFACRMCRKSLFGAKLLFRNDCLYCSHDCFNKDV